MLRFKILASTIPLILVGVFAGNALTPGARPCITVGETSVQMTAAPWKAQSHVSFTNDPAAATVRVQIVDNLGIADFVVVDDDTPSEANSCETTAATRLISIAERSSASEPVIYLTQANDADYRIYVKSKTFSAQEAAALVVGASDKHSRMAAASL